MTIGVVDYDAGNLRSVETALAHLGAKYILSSHPEELIGTDKLLFPGDGHAASAMENLAKTGLGEMLKEFFATGKSILGICVGSQIVLDFSEEGPTDCLGIIPGKCARLPGGDGLKVPHMGWNTMKIERPHPIFKDIPDNSPFYFVHSYYTKPSQPETTIGSTDYGVTFTTGMAWKNLVTFQFHPEKSGPVGLKLVDNFLQGRW